MGTSSASGPRNGSASGERGTEAGNPIDPRVLGVTFRRCWPWAVPLGLLLASVAALVVFQLFVPMYRAAHLLEANEDFVVFEGVMPKVEDLARSEKPLLLNPIVVDPVLADPALRSAPSLADPLTAEANLRRNLSVSSAGGRGRLTVHYDDTDPAAAALVCNAVVESYLRQRDAIDRSRISNLERWLEPEIERWEQQVGLKQQNVQRLTEQMLGYAPGQRIAALENQSDVTLLGDMRARIADLKVELAVLDAQQAMTTAVTVNETEPIDPASLIPDPVVLKAEPSERAILALIEEDPDVREAVNRFEQYRDVLFNLELNDLKRLRQEYYRETEGLRDEWRARLADAREAARGWAEEELRRRADADREQRQLEAEVEVELRRKQFQREQALAIEENARERAMAAEQQQRERDALMAKLEVWQREYRQEREHLEAYGGASAELQFAQEELDVANAVLRKLRDRAAAIRTERRQDGAVRTLAAATPPTIPLEKVPYTKLAMASGICFLLPFAIAFLWECKVERLTHSAAVDTNVRLAPVVGEVSKLPSRVGSRRESRMFQESIDSLRANLMLSVKTKGTRSIAVVSSVSGEGKSSVASQLALSLAKATGETVLLVDADLRCPDQHLMFGLEPNGGLCGVLAGEIPWKESVDRSLGELIHVIPAGKLHQSPHRLCNPAAMKEFMDGALEEYRYVVVDTAPVLAAGETLAVASAVDAVLLCVMRDVSRMECVLRTTRRLEAAGASLVGTVFNGVSSRQYLYRYGDYDYDTATAQSA